jgi:hypothetical protein
MRFIIMESWDPKEVDHFFEKDVVPTIGGKILHGSRVYEVLDIELHPSATNQEKMVVRAPVRRID